MKIFKDGFASEINKGGHLWIPDLRMNEKAIKFQLEHEKYPESDKNNKIIDSIVDDTLREVKIFRNYCFCEVHCQWNGYYLAMIII